MTVKTIRWLFVTIGIRVEGRRGGDMAEGGGRPPAWRRSVCMATVEDWLRLHHELLIYPMSDESSPT